MWILGVVDYHVSRLVALQGLPWPTTVAVTRVLDEAFRRSGVPVRILTDNGPIFRSEAFKTFLAEHNVRHSRIRPAHAWTNGRIERLFRTFKETARPSHWVEQLSVYEPAAAVPWPIAYTTTSMVLPAFTVMPMVCGEVSALPTSPT